MPVINLKSSSLHKRLKVKAAETDTTILGLVEYLLVLGLDWELYDVIVPSAVQSAADDRGVSVKDFLVESATR